MTHKNDTTSSTLTLPDGTVYEGRIQTDDEGWAVIRLAECGECGFVWNDALITSITPTPSGRCPNEYGHADDDRKAPPMGTKTDQAAQSADILREWLPKGSTVWTILRHVSRSGMVRDISPIAFVASEPRHLWWHVAHVTGRKPSPGNVDAVRCHGAGMDMGFDLVYSLSRALYDDGYALKQRWL